MSEEIKKPADADVEATELKDDQLETVAGGYLKFELTNAQVSSIKAGKTLRPNPNGDGTLID